MQPPSPVQPQGLPRPHVLCLHGLFGRRILDAAVLRPLLSGAMVLSTDPELLALARAQGLETVSPLYNHISHGTQVEQQRVLDLTRAFHGLPLDAEARTRGLLQAGSWELARYVERSASLAREFLLALERAAPSGLLVAGHSGRPEFEGGVLAAAALLELPVCHALAAGSSPPTRDDLLLARAAGRVLCPAPEHFAVLAELGFSGLGLAPRQALSAPLPPPQGAVTIRVVLPPLAQAVELLAALGFLAARLPDCRFVAGLHPADRADADLREWHAARLDQHANVLLDRDGADENADLLLTSYLNQPVLGALHQGRPVLGYRLPQGGEDPYGWLRPAVHQAETFPELLRVLQALVLEVRTPETAWTPVQRRHAATVRACLDQVPCIHAPTGADLVAVQAFLRGELEPMAVAARPGREAANYLPPLRSPEPAKLLIAAGAHFVLKTIEPVLEHPELADSKAVFLAPDSFVPALVAKGRQVESLDLPATAMSPALLLQAATLLPPLPQDPAGLGLTRKEAASLPYHWLRLLVEADAFQVRAVDLFRRRSPKLLLLGHPYAAKSLLLARLAAETGARTLAFEHGPAFPSHYALTALLHGGDYAALGDYSAQRLLTAGFSPERIHRCGLGRGRIPTGGDPSATQSLPPALQQRPYCVLASCPLDLLPGFTGRFLEHVRDTVAPLCQRHGATLVLKLHPTDRSAAEEHLAGSDVVVLRGEIDKAPLLGQARCLLALNSTILLEGILQGVPTAQLLFPDEHPVMPLPEGGLVPSLLTVEELEAFLRQVLAEAPQRLPAEASRDYFAHFFGAPDQDHDAALAALCRSLCIPPYLKALVAADEARASAGPALEALRERLRAVEALTPTASPEADAQLWERCQEYARSIDALPGPVIIYVAYQPYFPLDRQSAALRRLRGWSSVMFYWHDVRHCLDQAQLDSFDHTFVLRQDLRQKSSNLQLRRVFSLITRQDVVVHVTTHIKTPELFVAVREYAPFPVVYQPVDVLNTTINRPFYNLVWGADTTHFLMAAERYIHEHAAGLIHKEAPVTERLITPPPLCPMLLFEDYALPECCSPTRPQGSPPRLVYCGTFHPSTYPDSAQVVSRYYFEVTRELVKQGLPTHIYGGGYHGYGPQHTAYADWQTLALESGLVTLHGMVPRQLMGEELAQYDWGILNGFIHKMPSGYTNPQLFLTTMGTKVFTYLEAGLPMLVMGDYSGMAGFIEQYGVGLVLEPADLPRLRTILERADYAGLCANIERVRSGVLSMQGNIGRLDAFLRGLMTERPPDSGSR